MSERVIAKSAIVSKGRATIYLADGTTRELKQEDYRTAELVANIVSQVIEYGEASVDIESYSLRDKIVKILGDEFDITINKDGDEVIKKDGFEVPLETVERMAIRAALGQKEAKGFKNFMKKARKLRRNHTVKELMQFMKDNDLPIADDGSIIGYKILIDKGNGVMVDPHTQTVKQKLGSLVYMPKSKVDDNRRLQCSTGLHVCSYNYIKGFWHHGKNVLCLVKVKPVDVIAVPEYQSTKMRDSAYHIVHVFDKHVSDKIYGGAKPWDIPEAEEALVDVIMGNHTGILERVEVGANGTHDVHEVKQKPKKAKKKKTSSGRVVTTVRHVNNLLTPEKVKAMVKKGKQRVTREGRLSTAQRLFDGGQSIRSIATNLDIPRSWLSKNLIR